MNYVRERETVEWKKKKKNFIIAINCNLPHNNGSKVAILRLMRSFRTRLKFFSKGGWKWKKKLLKRAKKTHLKERLIKVITNNS
jgi:hypothetical protein